MSVFAEDALWRMEVQSRVSKPGRRLEEIPHNRCAARILSAAPEEIFGGQPERITLVAVPLTKLVDEEEEYIFLRDIIKKGHEVGGYLPVAPHDAILAYENWPDQPPNTVLFLGMDAVNFKGVRHILMITTFGEGPRRIACHRIGPDRPVEARGDHSALFRENCGI